MSAENLNMIYTKCLFQGIKKDFQKTLFASFRPWAYQKHPGLCSRSADSERCLETIYNYGYIVFILFLCAGQGMAGIEEEGQCADAGKAIMNRVDLSYTLGMWPNSQSFSRSRGSRRVQFSQLGVVLHMPKKLH